MHARLDFARSLSAVVLALVSLTGCGFGTMAREPALLDGGRGSSGVRVRQFDEGASRVTVIDIDLRTPGVAVEIAPRRPRRVRGRLAAEARTVAEWVSSSSALAGINGGFFGEALPTGETEVLGLFVQGGRSLAPAPPARSRSRGVSFARSCFGIRPDGQPSNSWAAAPAAGEVPRRYGSPEISGVPAREWPVEAALGCGPRLIHQGKRWITDRQERLVSAGPLPRTFLGYAVQDERPRHLVLATATALDFDGCARALTRYFERKHRTRPQEAMALDGGSSTQLAYRAGDRIVEPHPGLVTVPTAVLVRDARTAGR